MGGKVLLQIVKQFPELITKGIIVDIAPREYQGGHEKIFKSLLALNLHELTSRTQAFHALNELINDEGVSHFLLKNLKRNQDGLFSWKANIKELWNNYNNIKSEISFPEVIHHPLLYVKGLNSDYISRKDESDIKNKMVNAEFIDVEGAGHWVHSDKPKEMLDIISTFIN